MNEDILEKLNDAHIEVTLTEMAWEAELDAFAEYAEGLQEYFYTVDQFRAISRSLLRHVDNRYHVIAREYLNTYPYSKHTRLRAALIKLQERAKEDNDMWLIK